MVMVVVMRMDSEKNVGKMSSDDGDFSKYFLKIILYYMALNLP